MNKDDNHIVFVRPKALVDSSGTTWANETERLRSMFPDKFEVLEGGSQVNYSAHFRGVCARIQDDVRLFIEMTVAEDLERVCNSPENIHYKYESERISHLVARLETSLTSCEVNHLSETESSVVARDIVPQLTKLIQEGEALNGELILIACTADLQKQYSTYIATCNGLLEKLAELKLPPVKPRWADFTDAGPGVGCSNFEVRFRDAELALIHNSDHRILAYPSRENSADNEAERTNSAIGDSIVDGSTIQWEQYKKFDGLSDEEISTLTLKEYEEHERQRMEKNAWHCAGEISKRIDGAPVFNEFIQCFVTEKKNTFFFNKTYPTQYSSAGSTPQRNLFLDIITLQRL